MRTVPALVVCLGSLLLTATADAGDVCTYTVHNASTGVLCPVKNVNTACRSLSAVTGACNVPLQCFGGKGFFCRFLLIPKSGPQAQCPFSFRRLEQINGLRCTRFFGVRTSTPTVTRTPRTTPTRTPTPTLTIPLGCPDVDATPTPASQPPAPGDDSLTPGPCTDAETGVAGTSPGSIVVLPKIVADQNRDTVIELTNRTNRVAFAVCFYLNGVLTDPSEPPGPLNPPLLIETDFMLALTAQQPIQWTLSIGRAPTQGMPLPGTIPPVVTPFVGELKCVEVDATMVPISGNSFTAAATLLGPAGDVSKYDAVTFRGTDNNNGDNVLNLDDVEYTACPRELIFNLISDGAAHPVLGAAATVSNRISLVTCREDFEAQQYGPVSVFAMTTDEFELLLSASFTVDGYLDIDLPDLNAVFTSFGESFRQLRLRSSMTNRCVGGTNNGAVCSTDVDCPGNGSCLMQSPVLATLETTHINGAGGSGRAMHNAHTCASNPAAAVTLPFFP